MLIMLGWLALALVLAVVAVLIVAAARPNRFLTSRSTRIAAPPERLHPLISSPRQMNTWNPYALRETSGTVAYSGPESGKGARFAFSGPKSGTGTIEVVDESVPSKVVMRLLMTKPFKADNTVEFTLRPEGAGTEVTWAMSGRQPLLAKAMTLFIDCDKMVGRDFEEGLARLKTIAEAGAA